MADVVTTVLQKPTATKIAFSFGSVKVDATSFPSVIKAIADGKITISTEGKRGAGLGVYSYKKNKFTFGFAATNGNADQEALVLHESVHAAFDVAKTPMLMKESEAAAYIAQCMFFYYTNEAAIAAGSAPSFAHPILKAAWPVAVLAVKQPALTQKDVEALLTAIAGHPLYKNRISEKDDFDGV